MQDIAGRYPLSTGDSQAIPLDIIRPEGLILFTLSSISPTTSHDLGSTIDCFAMQSNVDTILHFSSGTAIAAAPAPGVFQADSLYLPANTTVIVSPPIDKRHMSAIALSGSGTLLIQYLQTWSGLALKSQYQRR